MRVITPQITWHNRDPVLCVDFDPSCFLTNDDTNTTNYYRLATGGSDSHLLIWHLRDPDSIKLDLTCASELTRHTKAVNTVRFSPCGRFLASADDDAYVYIWKNDTELMRHGEEFWTVEKALRKHIDDVSDLSWSSDSGRLVTTSVDNSAIIWDIKKGIPLHIWSEHGGFVQGANFDPAGEFVATISTDRTLRFFNPQSGKLGLKVLKYPSKWLPAEKGAPGEDAGNSVEENLNGQSKKSTQVLCNRIFHDDTLKSFCRRLSFSPKGEFLVVPGGIMPPNNRNEFGKSPSGRKQGRNETSSPKTKGVKSKKFNQLVKDKPISDKNAVIIFCRNSFTNPCSIIPTGTAYSIAVRFCPLYFQRSRDLITYDKSLMNPPKRSERMVTCVGKLKESKIEKKVLLDMPYRLVFAVGTSDSVIISDTESSVPLAVIRNIHLTRMSDLSWSADGRLLIVSSTDGYCSIISFEEKELGVPFEQETTPVPPHGFPISLPPIKQKTVKVQKKRPRKGSVKSKESKKETKISKIPKKLTTKIESAKKHSSNDIKRFFIQNKTDGSISSSPIMYESTNLITENENTWVTDVKSPALAQDNLTTNSTFPTLLETIPNVPYETPTLSGNTESDRENAPTLSENVSNIEKHTPSDTKSSNEKSALLSGNTTSEKIPTFSIFTPSGREKRRATSPLSSQQRPKQPRRVEFVTLSKSPPRPKED